MGVRRIRYRMDTTLVLFLLLMFGSDPAFKEKLQNFLGFYRENRELIRTFCGAATAAQPESPESPADRAQKSAPPEQTGDANVLERYLARMMG